MDALGTAKALVILFSDHSNASRQLIKELALADNLQKPIVPVLVSNCEPKGAYLYEMASRNWIKIHPDPETRLASLVDKLITELKAARRRSSAGPGLSSNRGASTAARPRLLPQPSRPPCQALPHMSPPRGGFRSDDTISIFWCRSSWVHS